MPGPVSRGCRQGDRLWLKHGFVKSALQILPREAPGEGLPQSGVALAEGVNGFGNFVKPGVVIWLEHFALDN